MEIYNNLKLFYILRESSIATTAAQGANKQTNKQKNIEII